MRRPMAFQVMVKPIGPICNMNCTYCYYLDKKNLYKNTSDFKLPLDTLEMFTKHYINAQEVPGVTFVWQGGEPTLLGVDYFEKALEFQRKYVGDMQVENNFQTNGTLLTPEWCKFFRKHDILVGVSIDGPRHIHDHYRIFKNGEPTFDKVMEGIELLKRYGVRFNTLSCVNNYNVYYPLEIYHFLKEIGSQFMQFIPIIERHKADDKDYDLDLVSPEYGFENAALTEWSIPGEDEYGTFLNTIFDEWVRNDVGNYYVQHFDVALANWYGTMPGLCVFGKTCGDALVLEHNGDLFSCDHYVYPENFLGNIKQDSLKSLVKSEQQIKFGNKKQKDLPAQCKKCDYLFACNGGCPKNRTSITPAGETGLNHLCKSYYKFFKHVHPYMQFMSDELHSQRAPANVMEWVRKMDFRKSIRQSQAGRKKIVKPNNGKKQKKNKINKN